MNTKTSFAKGQLKIQPVSQERLEAVRPRMFGLFEERALE